MWWYQLTTKEVVEKLGTDITQGLSTAEVLRRLQEYGPNQLQERKQETLLKKFVDQLKNRLVLILIGASFVSLLVGEGTDALIIIAIVLLNAMLGVFQEFKAEQALAVLKRMTAPQSKVLRDDQLHIVPARDLVPGDIVLLEAGDYIPADVRIIESANVKVEEASLTGESVPVEKFTGEIFGDAEVGERTNMGFMGTLITYGRGKGIVTETAMRTEIGKIAGMLQTNNTETTPLQRKLEHFGNILGLICFGVCALVILLGLWDAFADGMLQLPEIQLVFMTAISLAVAAIPEGLPTVVTMVLALGMQRMVKRNAVIKRLHAVETLGSVTVICSDKTGTLTQNQMTVVQTYVNGRMLNVSGEGYSPEGAYYIDDQRIDVQRDPDLERLLIASVLCNDAKLEQKDAPPFWSIIGDPTEGALLVAGAKGGYHSAALDDAYPRIQEIPFDSERKLMTTLHQTGAGNVVAFIKGAPDAILSRCTQIREDGRSRSLTEADILRIQQANTSMASHALRVLAIAYCEFTSVPQHVSSETIESNLIFVGLQGMIDPPRAEARAAVKACKSAGIRVIMITGDQRDTAYAIATSLGIADESSSVFTGREISNMNEAQLREAVNSAAVFARVSPEHKVSIVESLRKNGDIVAMTGDGVNDAPALKRADIGVAMGLTGTGVTKETADIIITDDNFASIVSAVEEGRIIFSNVRKFIYFLLSCNAAEILVVFLAMLFGLPIPLLPIQLLWMNLVTDAFPALALGMEKKERNVMQHPPRDPQEPLLHRKLIVLIAVQSVLMSIATLVAFYYGLIVYQHDLAAARTLAFVTLIFSQLLCAYAARSDSLSAVELRFFSNGYLNLGVAVAMLLMLLSVYGPLHSIFNTIELSIQDWSVILLLAPVAFVGVEFIKRGLRNRQN